jgi:prevent-host-death family protein
MRQSVGSRELKTRLGTYLRRVRRGATLVVTDRHEPVAELRPVAHGASPEEAGLAALEALGAVTRGQGLRRLASFRPIRSKGPPASQVVIEGREERL